MLHLRRSSTFLRGMRRESSAMAVSPRRSQRSLWSSTPTHQVSHEREPEYAALHGRTLQHSLPDVATEIFGLQSGYKRLDSLDDGGLADSVI